MAQASASIPHNKFVAFINSRSAHWLIFGLLALNLLTFVPQTNEENYLLYAKQFADSDWIPDSFMATEFPGSRLLFETLFAQIIQLVGFEGTVFLGRLSAYFLLAIPLALIFRKLNFSNVKVLLLLQTFVLTKQSFYAGEWIFGGIEAKSLAYIFIFWAILSFFRQKYYRAITLVILATYFHVLIGGWFAISAFLVLLFQGLPFIQLVKLGLFYGISILPLLLYLMNGIFASKLAVDSTNINLDYIYVYFRNKHHLGLFASFDFFFRRHFFNIGLATTVVFYLWYSQKVRAFFKLSNDLSLLRNFVFAMSTIGFIYIGIGLMDNLFFELSGGFMLKSYPFRMQALALLFSMILGMAFFTRTEKQQHIWQKSRAYFLVLVSLIAVIRFGVNVNSMLTYQNDVNYNAVIDYLKNETPKPSTVLVLNQANKSTDDNRHKNTTALDLMRRTERDIFVHYKFVPTTAQKMAEWYKRLELVRMAEQDSRLVAGIAENYKIDYVLSPSGMKFPYTLVLENEAFLLYELTE